MALIDPEVVKHEIPHEPGQWVKCRTVTAGDIEDIALAGQRATNNRVISIAVVEWSYPGDPTYDAVRRLDLVTLDWLTEIVNRTSAIRTDEKKESSEPASLPVTELVTASSRRNSGT